MIGRADIEGLKSNITMNAWLPQASYPCGNFSNTSSFKFRRSKGSIRHTFAIRIRTGNQNQTSFYPFVPHEISVLVERASCLAKPGMCRGIWRTKDQMMPMVCEITYCSSQGICRGWSRHLGTPRRGWCRWCASQPETEACRGIRADHGPVSADGVRDRCP